MSAQSRATRAQTRLAGRALLERGSTRAVACFVQDLSPAGACVVFPKGVVIPRHFDLFIGLSVQSHRARTMWQQAGMAGVMFLEARANAPEVVPS